MPARQLSAPHPPFRLRGRCGEPLVLRLTVASRMVAPAVLRPELDAWVTAAGGAVETPPTIAPGYVYLTPGQEARITVSAGLPRSLAAGEVLRGGLRFPGVDDLTVPLELAIGEGPARDHYLHVTMPLSPYEPGGDEPPDVAATRAVSTLLAGLAGLEVVPARWVVTELLLTICELGARLSETPAGGETLERLSRLRFFKNGVLAFRGAHLPTWIMIGVTVSTGLGAALGGKAVQGRLLYGWEKWLLDLIDIDLEDFEQEAAEVLLPPPDLDASLARIGNEAEHWFGYLLLGLMDISPRLRAVLSALAASAPPPVASGPRQEADIDDVLSEDGSIYR